MNKLFCLIIMFIICGVCKGQNLVQNFSFEDTIPCSNNPNPGGVEATPPWFTPTSGSPDYFNFFYSSNCGGGGVPYIGPFGFQYPRTGHGLCGFTLYHPLASFEFREYMENILLNTLIQNHKYCVQFYISLANTSTVGIDKIGMYFSTDSIYNINTTSVLQYTPQIENQIGNIIVDTMNWVLVSGEYIAQGGEKYITIGNFYSNVNTDTIMLNYGSPAVG